jgi:Cft2 family RNA processing exonuclease
MDINLKKEVVLDGVGLALLPTAPALLIVEGGSVSRGAAVGKQVILKRGKKEDSVGLVSTVMDALRDGGNVLIPCEAGRALEVMQVLGKLSY